MFERFEAPNFREEVWGFVYLGGMETHVLLAATDWPLIVGVIIGMIAICLIVWGLVKAEAKSVSDTQRHLTDVALLELIDRQPDGLLSPHQLRDATPLTLTQARSRLSALYSFGILNRSYSNKARHYYGLREPLAGRPELTFSNEPFLTTEDLLAIFRHYDYRPTAQQLILATGLPLGVVKREMKYFEKEKVVQKLSRMDGAGVVSTVFYILLEPYRSDPGLMSGEAERLDLEMRALLRAENLIV